MQVVTESGSRLPINSSKIPTVPRPQTVTPSQLRQPRMTMWHNPLSTDAAKPFPWRGSGHVYGSCYLSPHFDASKSGVKRARNDQPLNCGSSSKSSTPPRSPRAHANLRKAKPTPQT